MECIAHPLGVQQVVGPGCHNDLGLLLNCEVGPRELRINVLLVHLQNLIMTDSSRVGVVHDSCQASLSLQQAHATDAEQYPDCSCDPLQTK